MRLPPFVLAGITGSGATLPMTAWMTTGDRAERIGTPPPLRIVQRRLPSGAARHDRRRAAILHLLIGAAGGVGAQIAGGRRGASGIGTALATAVGLWATGYELVVPALGVLPPAHRDRARAAALLEAHLVYRTALAALHTLLRRVAFRS